MPFSNMKWRISGQLFQRVAPRRNDLHQQQPTEHQIDADTKTHRADRVTAAEQTAEDSEGQALEHSFEKINGSAKKVPQPAVNRNGTCFSMSESSTTLLIPASLKYIFSYTCCL